MIYDNMHSLLPTREAHSNLFLSSVFTGILLSKHIWLISPLGGSTQPDDWFCVTQSLHSPKTWLVFQAWRDSTWRLLSVHDPPQAIVSVNYQVSFREPPLLIKTLLLLRKFHVFGGYLLRAISKNRTIWANLNTLLQMFIPFPDIRSIIK